MDADESFHIDEYCLFEDAALQLSEDLGTLTKENAKLKQRIGYLKKALEAHECIGCLDRRYPHPKLRNVKCETIEPFTYRLVQAAIKDGKYTLRHFREGYKGFVRFLLSIVTKGDEKSYVYVPETSSFYMLSDYHTWEKDNEGRYIRYIIDGMKDIRNEYWAKVMDQCDTLTVPTETAMFYEGLVRSRSTIEQRRLILLFIRDCLALKLSI